MGKLTVIPRSGPIGFSVNRNKIIIILLLSILINYSQAQAITKSINATACKTTEYFDSSELQCITCTNNTVPASNQLACECDKGYYILGGTQINQFIPNCALCELPDTYPTHNKSRCLPCGNTTLQTSSSLVSLNKDCLCDKYQTLVETYPNGTYMEAKECQTCQQGLFPGPADHPVYTCAACPVEGQSYLEQGKLWECTCLTKDYTAAKDVCYLNSDADPIKAQYSVENGARTINYDYVETKASDKVETLSSVSVVISDTYNYLYYDAAIGCAELEDPQKCQALANLCVLQLYNEQKVACRLFKNITTTSQTNANVFYNDNGWKTNLPWLYYERSSGEVLYQSKRVKMRVSFGYENQKIGIINKLTYKLAKYDLEGNFYGFETLTDQLQICETSTEEVERLAKFGTTILNECTFDLSRLTSSNIYDHPRNENMFYELFLQDYNGDLIDVPVLIRNFNDQNGGNPNAESPTEDDNTYRLVRRFFLFDTVSGVEGTNAYIQGKISNVIRYPKSITLRIKLDPDNQEMIFTPLLIINYRERSQTTIEEMSLSQVSFTAEYAMDTTAFWKVCKIVFIIINILFAIILIIKMIVWWQNPVLNTDTSAQCKYAIVKFFITAIDLYSNIFFWFLVILTGYWFIFFKLQERVYVLLPALNTYSKNYKPYDFLFFIVFGSKALSIIFKIAFEQSSFDVFLIDWERPKLPYSNNSRMGVNAWRSLFLVNELNELQLSKLISIEFTLLLYVFIMEGFGWKYWATHDPDFTTKQYNSPSSYPLNFFVTAIVMYVIGIAQYLLRYLIKFRVPLKIEEFTDICSVCNISILLFDNTFHGYYIHGRSPYGQAEVSSEVLRKSLEYEESGKAQQRGLTSSEPQLQTFEIYMPERMLQDYKDYYLKDVNEEILKQKNDNTRRFNSVEVMLTNQAAVPKNLDLENLEDQRVFMNMLMQTYIEQVRTEPRKFIQDRSAIQRLLQLPSQIVGKGVPIMFRDKWYSFSNLFLQGLDFDFLMMDVLMITLVDNTASNNTNLSARLMLGILCAYILDQSLIFLRSYLGRKNLAKHTLADERFLI